MDTDSLTNSDGKDSTESHYNFNIKESWYTVSQAAAILGIPKSEVKRKYPYIVIEGGTRLFHWKDIGYNPKVGPM